MLSLVMENDNEVTQTAEEFEQVEHTEEATETSEQSEEDADIRYLNQKKRAEKAEAELKALKESMKTQESKPAKSKETKNPITSDRDETFIISALSSKGLSFEEIDTYLTKAKKISAIEEIPLSKALDTDIFKAFDKSYQEEKKREQASMGASRGSGSAAQKKTLLTPGLSDKEWNELHRKQILGL